MNEGTGRPPYADRDAAAEALAGALHDLADDPQAIVLGLARGGVPVAAGIAHRLGLEWDALVVRKLGVPGQPEVAFGALAAHGRQRAAFRSEAIRSGAARRAPRRALREVEQAERAELERRHRDYLAGRVPDVAGRTVVVADDGLATGATLRAALDVLARSAPARLVAALPVGPPSTCAELEASVDRLVCPHRPANFGAVGAAYEHFDQVSDAWVHDLLDGPGGPGFTNG
ncbi:phosphoribosyltransferase [Zhihengliuella halotolerans]|uniref:phosphoribosyltransferase n=1 Tax=Zhihengliuella halotolerans TaxID=370736 RepID=UPI000C7FB2E4|nr:phosphoribosyltransferase family protein [Zhihengliuella halotolerans]